MNNYDDKNILNESHIVYGFNRRDSNVFSSVYSMYYNEFILYAMKLYDDTSVSPYDIVQDIFIKLLEKTKIKFSSLVSIKSYIYVSIKNGYLDYLKHNKCVSKYSLVQLEDPNFNLVHIVESETYSLLSHIEDILPSECASVFKLYLQGWSVKEISDKLGKAQSTIYTQKQDAISILKRKLDKNKLLLLVNIITTLH